MSNDSSMNSITTTNMETMKLHFILIPFFAQGHLIPMLDIGRLLATRGVLVSLVVSPVNESRIKPIIDRLNLAGVPIQLIVLEFPGAQVGLPPGCENIDQQHLDVPLALNFFEAMEMLRSPLLHKLSDMQPKPTCIVADSVNIVWTKELADELCIPRLLFHGPSCFYLLCTTNIYRHNIHQRVTDDSEPFVVPDMNDLKIEITKQQTTTFINSPKFKSPMSKLVEARSTADGMIINSFQELEGEFLDRYQEKINKKVWSIGPVSLCNEGFLDRAQRGQRASVPTEHILTWLNSKDDNSVIYVSFGSHPLKNWHLQHIEIGLGLEASNTPFIWVIKEREWSPEFEIWLSDTDFKKRVQSRGLIIKGWSPQTLVLSHRAVGAFITHCGWNSTLEAVAAGVPMATWPLFADQYLNEKLVVQVLDIGVEVSAKKHVIGREELVGRDEVEKAVMTVMEGEERRRRAKEFGEKAKKAMQIGSSSYNNLSLMIEYILDLGNKGESV